MERGFASRCLTDGNNARHPEDPSSGSLMRIETLGSGLKSRTPKKKSGPTD
jgi:hypothetical protein